VKKAAEKGSSQRRVDENGIDTKGVHAMWHCFSEDIQKFPVAFGACYVHFTTEKEKRNVTKFVFVYWNGDDAGVKQKMTYSSTKLAVSKKIGTFHFQLQINGKSDLDWKDILDTVGKNER